MDPFPSKRVNRSSSHRSEQNKRSYLSTSPTPRRDPQKRQHKTKEREKENKTAGEYWSIKGILDEKREHGKLFYLVAWEDDPATGEHFSPSWEPYNYVTEDERVRWQRKQQKLEQVEAQSEQLSSPTNSSGDTSLRTATKRKRRATSVQTSSVEEPSRKILRSEEKETRRSTETPKTQYKHKTEIKDSYEEDSNDNSDLARGASPLVEVSVNEDFDRTVYARIASSQLSQSSFPQNWTASSPDTPQPRERASRSIWNEPLTQGIIPDSQEFCGSDSYNPSTQTTTAITDGTHHDTVSISEDEVESYESAATHGDPSDSRSSQSIANRPIQSRSSLGKTITSGQSGSSSIAQPQHLSTLQSNLVEIVHNSPSTDRNDPNSQSSQIIVSERDDDQQCQLGSPFSIREAHLLSSDSQVSSSPPLHTQLPPENWPNAQNPSASATSPTLIGARLTKPRIELDTFTSGRSIPPSLVSLHATNPSQAGILGPSYLVSPTPLPAINSHLSNPQQTSASQTGSNFIFQHSQSEDSSQESQSRSQGEKSVSSHLPSPPFEDILPSIEPTENIAISPQPVSPTARTPKLNCVTIERSAMDEIQVAESGIGPSTMVGLAQKPSRSAIYQAERDDSTSSPPSLQSSRNASHNQAAVVQKTSLLLQHTVEGPMLAQSSSHPEYVAFGMDTSEERPHIIGDDPDDYVVPLPMVSHPRDIYSKVLRNHRKQIQMLLNDEAFDATLVSEIDSMLDELRKLCDHQNLHEDQFSTQIHDDDTTQAKWAENISTKCIFLAELLAQLTSTLQNIIVFVRPGRMLQILEAVFKWHNFTYSVAGQSRVQGDIDEPMTITLVPTTGEPVFTSNSLDSIIAFDSTYKAVPNLDQLRLQESSRGRQIPLISLVVTHSIEHLERHMGGDFRSIEHKIAVVGHLIQLYDTVGKLPFGEDYQSPPTAARDVARFLMEGGRWPLQALPEIENLVYETQETQVKEVQSAAPLVYDSTSLSQTYTAAAKRNLEDDYIHSESPKRQRLSTSPDMLANLTGISNENSEISSSTTHVTKSTKPVTVPSHPVEDVSDDEDEDTPILQRLQSLRLRLAKQERIESDLKQENAEILARWQDLDLSLRAIQPKYQEALNDRGKFEYQCKQALAKEERVTKNLESKTAALEQLKIEKAAVDSELAAARKILSASTIPEIAAMEALRADMTTLKETIYRLEKSKESQANTLKYIQDAYQLASSASAEAASEVSSLQAENAALKRKADDNAVKIHAIQRDRENRALMSTVKRLRGSIKEKDKQLAKAATREREAAVSGLRRGMRGASQGPRSPRMPSSSGTMSPNQRIVSGSAITGAGSAYPQPGTISTISSNSAAGGNGSGNQRVSQPGNYPSTHANTNTYTHINTPANRNSTPPFPLLPVSVEHGIPSTLSSSSQHLDLPITSTSTDSSTATASATAPPPPFSDILFGQDHAQTQAQLRERDGRGPVRFGSHLKRDT